MNIMVEHIFTIYTTQTSTHVTHTLNQFNVVVKSIHILRSMKIVFSFSCVSLFAPNRTLTLRSIIIRQLRKKQQQQQQQQCENTFFPPNMAFVKCGKYTKLTILHRMLGTHFELPHSHICCCCYCCCCCCMPLLVIDKINKVKLKFLYIYTFCEFRMWMLPPLRVRLDRYGDDGANEREREKLLAHQRHKQQQQDFFLSAEEQKKRPILHFIFCSSVSSYSHTLRSYITHSHMILGGVRGGLVEVQRKSKLGKKLLFTTFAHIELSILNEFA